MLKTAAAALGLALLLLPATAGAIDFQIAQAWSYETRPGEEGSQIYIAKIDRDIGTKTIYHIYIDGLHLKNPLVSGGEQATFSPLPITKEALEASVIGEPRRVTAVPDISEGYVIWREAYLQGRAGVFTIPVKQAIQHVEDAFNQTKQ